MFSPFKTRSLSVLLALSLALAPMAASRAQVRLPSLGDTVSDEFGVGAERRLGDQVMREIWRDPDYLDDPLLLEYVQSLWSPLLDAARRRGDIGADIAATFAWDTFLVRDRGVNAFALPGGYVGVYLGLIAMTSSGDELAAVLGHEMSHITQRHIARSMSNSQRQSMAGLAALVLGVIAASRSRNADIAQAAVIGGQAAMIQGQLNFSRDMEREADRIGWGVMTGAGFSPAGVAAMFEKLENANRLNDSGAFPYLRSHPLTVDRIGEARSRIDASGVKGAPPTTLAHAAMQARSRILMDPSDAALRRQQAHAAAPGASRAERLSALYGNALASLLLKEPVRAQASALAAQDVLNEERATDAFAQRSLRLLQGQVLLARGESAAALRLLDDGPATEQASRAVTLAVGQAALDAARQGGLGVEALRQSTQTLQTWVTVHRHDAAAWSLLAQSAEQLGLRLRAIRAEAEARAAIGDLTGAIDRLRAGQRQVRSGQSTDFIEASVIDARLRDLERERRQWAMELNGGREPPHE